MQRMTVGPSVPGKCIRSRQYARVPVRSQVERNCFSINRSISEKPLTDNCLSGKPTHNESTSYRRKDNGEYSLFGQAVGAQLKKTA
jgi:hypothetical protein